MHAAKEGTDGRLKRVYEQNEQIFSSNGTQFPPLSKGVPSLGGPQISHSGCYR
jgi:hypothetical protein